MLTAREGAAACHATGGVYVPQVTGDSRPRRANARRLVAQQPQATRGEGRGGGARHMHAIKRPGLHVHKAARSSVRFPLIYTRGNTIFGILLQQMTRYEEEANSGHTFFFFIIF